MLANLRALFGVVVDIVLLRRGPENLPASPQLLAACVVLNVLLYGLAYYALVVPRLPGESSAWPLQILVGAIVSLAWFRVAFIVARKPERFVQTMIAVFAVNTLFIPAAVPLVAALIPYLEKPGTPAPALLAFAMAIVGIWLLVVTVRIVRAAFEWSWPGSVVFVLGGNFATVLFLGLLFGESSKAA